MKKTVLLFFVVILVLSVCAACGKTAAEIRETVEDTDYSITYYWGPPLKDFNEETVVQMKEAGFDTIPLQRFPENIDSLKSAVELLEKHGLFAAVCDGRITDLYNASYVPSQKRIDAAVTEVVEDYKEYGNIREWILCDEPSPAKFKVLGRLVDAFRRIDPERKTFINLLPLYAPAEALTISYQEYIDSFCETVKPDYLCYDYYDFLGSGTTDSRRGTYLQNMEIIKKAAEKYDLETRVIVLLTEHGDYSNVTAAEIAWQANFSLLYGMKCLSYFTYWEPDDPNFTWSNAMVDIHGTVLQHYYDVQKENKTTRVLGNALYNTNCDKVFLIDTDLVSGADTYESYGTLGKVSGEDFLAGFYENGWFLLMNANTVSGKERTLITEELKDGLFWLNTETKRWESIHSCPFIEQKFDGRYEIRLDAGRAVLLRTEQ
ncbi:MAG: hypothetical protein ACLSVG_07450 [Clostridia bacterium]